VKKRKKIFLWIEPFEITHESAIEILEVIAGIMNREVLKITAGVLTHEVIEMTAGIVTQVPVDEILKASAPEVLKILGIRVGKVARIGIQSRKKCHKIF